MIWGPPGAEPAERAERADAARNRQVLLATARHLIAEHGADKLTMDGLAERAGLGKGTVYRRFASRAGIEFLIRHSDIARAALDGREQVPAGSQTPMSRMHIRALLGQLSLGDVDLDVLATQLTSALDGPLLLYLSSDTFTQAGLHVSERLGAGWEDLVRRVCRP